MLIGLPIAIGGISLLVAYQMRRERVAQMQGWPTAAGLVVSTEVASNLGSEGIAFEPIVHYEYWVDGESFSGSRLYSEGVPGSFSTGTVLRSYARGDRVTVYYDPANPGRGFLEFRQASYVHPYTIAGAVIALVGLLLLLRSPNT